MNEPLNISAQSNTRPDGIVHFEVKADIPPEWAPLFRAIITAAIQLYTETAAEKCDVLRDTHGDFRPVNMRKPS